jgi:two-component system, response regulator PdtaR
MRSPEVQGLSLVDLTVLLVEDELLIALDIKMMLERRGARVVGPATTVGEALHLLRSERPDVALLDVNLKHELVTPVAEELQARDIPFVVSSAHNSANLAAITILADAPKVGKPASERRLIAALAKAAELSRS